MSTVIVVFPPGAGGNHLRNIVVSCYDGTDQFKKIYRNQTTIAHARVGCNLHHYHLENAVAHQDQVHVVHGHFGEIMSFQNQIRGIPDKKFIILSPDTPADSAMLNLRRLAVGQTQLVDGDYFDGEQVFLYEPFMYHWYFQTPMDNIMNISISDWFTQDIDPALDKLSYFLGCNIDKEKINSVHKGWIEANNL
jgi:hypothetical protein